MKRFLCGLATGILSTIGAVIAYAWWLSRPFH